MASFQELPLELQLHVAESCTRSTLLSFATTSKALHQLLTPVIYRVVDLSSHNGPDINALVKSIKVPPDWPRRRRNPNDGIVYDKQRAFIKTIRSRPSLGEHVKILRWTTVDFSEHVYEGIVNPLCDRYLEAAISRRRLMAYLEEYTFNGCNSRLWDTFAALTHVQEVDIAFLNEAREACPPPPLFQEAQSLRLSGMASSFLIRSILKSIDPRSLRQLHLNNLNQFAELEGVPEDLTLREKGKLVPFSRVAGRAGPMRIRFLECSSGWDNLQSLIIDTVGLTGPDSERADSADTKLSEAEDARYRELGALIKSVAKTLRFFRFQQGPTAENHLNGWRRSPGVRCGPSLPPRDGLRPMDTLFQQHILSAILENTWPQLERMELFGVASNTSYPNRRMPWINSPLPDETLSQIRKAVGPDPVLDIRTDAMRLFWLADDSEGPGVYEINQDEWTENEEESDSDSEEES